MQECNAWSQGMLNLPPGPTSFNFWVFPGRNTVTWEVTKQFPHDGSSAPDKSPSPAFPLPQAAFSLPSSLKKRLRKTKILESRPTLNIARLEDGCLRYCD